MSFNLFYLCNIQLYYYLIYFLNMWVILLFFFRFQYNYVYYTHLILFCCWCLSVHPRHTSRALLPANKACQFMQNPQEYHCKAVKRILRYLAGTTAHGLLIRSSPSMDILAFSGADQGSDVDDRKSTTGYCVYLGANLITWSSHKQKLVSRSSTYAQYRSIATVLTEIIWIHSLLRELHISTGQTKLFYLLSANPIMHPRTKHFELDIHFVRDYVQKQFVKLLYLPACFQVVRDYVQKQFVKLLYLYKDNLRAFFH